MPYKNLEEQKEYKRKYHRDWYARNKEKRLPELRDRKHREIRANQKNVLDHLNSHPCIDCGESDPVVLEFDHVRGVKVKEISKMVRSGSSWHKIQEEISKCDVRCANCHRRATYRRRQTTGE